MRRPLADLDGRTLRLNLVATQLLLLAVAATGSLYLMGWEKTVSMWSLSGWLPVAGGAMAAGGIFLVSLLMERYVPRRWLDDSDINRKLFCGVSQLTAFFLCLLVGISEEWLFRGVLQPLAGNGWTSALFTLMHVRYWRRPLLCGVVYGISFLLGSLYDLYGSLWPCVAAHALADFLLAWFLVRQTLTNEGR